MLCQLNGTDPDLCKDGQYIITTHSSTKTRNYFTIAFTILQVMIPYIGVLCIKRLNQRRVLARDSHVPLSLISPWLSVPSILNYLFKTRRLPGRYWGLGMLLIGCFGWATHFLVNGIASPYLPDICQDYPVVFVDTVQANTNGKYYPPPFWSVSTWSVTSQKTSYFNRIELDLESKIGISEKASNDPYFYAKDEEILGGWSCTKTNASGSDLTIQNDSINMSVISSHFINKGLVYPSNGFTEYSPSLASIEYSDAEGLEAVLAWSANPDVEAWDVKAAMMSNINRTMKSYDVKAFQCELVSKSK